MPVKKENEWPSKMKSATYLKLLHMLIADYWMKVLSFWNIHYKHASLLVYSLCINSCATFYSC